MEKTNDLATLPIGNGKAPISKYRPGSIDYIQYRAIEQLIEQFPKQSGRALAQRLGVSKNVLYRLLRKYGLKTGFRKRPQRRKSSITKKHASFLGVRQGKVTVVDVKTTSNPYRQWLVIKCACGVEKTIHLESFKKNERKSCGCEQYKRHFKKQN